MATYGSLDIAVNNVGMMGGLAARPSLDLDAEYIRRIVDLNLMSALLCSVAEARAMVAAGRGGVIVNVTSGETTRAAPGLVPYAAAKAAVNHVCRSLAVELGPNGIRVHAVAPGTTPTEHVRAALSAEHLDALGAATPLGRLCEPDDLARLVLFLVSDLSAAVTGQLVLSDCGAHAALARPPSAPTASVIGSRDGHCPWRTALADVARAAGLTGLGPLMRVGGVDLVADAVPVIGVRRRSRTPRAR